MKKIMMLMVLCMSMMQAAQQEVQLQSMHERTVEEPAELPAASTTVTFQQDASQELLPNKSCFSRLKKRLCTGKVLYSLGTGLCIVGAVSCLAAWFVERPTPPPACIINNCVSNHTSLEESYWDLSILSDCGKCRWLESELGCPMPRYSEEALAMVDGIVQRKCPKNKVCASTFSKDCFSEAYPPACEKNVKKLADVFKADAEQC